MFFLDLMFFHSLFSFFLFFVLSLLYSTPVAAQLTTMGQWKHKAGRRGSKRTRGGQKPETKPSMNREFEQPLATELDRHTAGTKAALE